MLIVAVVGLCVNLISMRLLSVGKDTSMNMKGAYLEVWSDMLGSIGVIVGALIIRFTGWTWVDSVVAVAIGLWVLPRTWSLLKDSINILLEGVPEDIGLEKVEVALRNIPGVSSVHDLHIWAISSGKTSLTAHIVCAAPDVQKSSLLQSIRSVVAERFDIHHSTIQLEDVSCVQVNDMHSFGPASSDEKAAPSH